MMSKKVLKEKVERYQELKAQLEVMEAELEEIKNELTNELERRKVEELAVGPNFVRWTYYVQNRFDSTAFKKAHPMEYAMWQKQVSGHRFSVA